MKTVPLRHLAQVWSSSVDKHSHEDELSVQLCNYTDAYKRDTVRPGPDLMRATATPDEIRRNRLEVGDTVFTKDSEDPNDIGISAYVDGTAHDFVCGYHLAIARPTTLAFPRFITWVLRSKPVLDHFATHASGISRYGLSLDSLRSSPVPDVTHEDQRRIADFLDDRVSRIDRIIAARRTQGVLLTQQVKSALAGLVLDGQGTIPVRRLIHDEKLGLWGDDSGSSEVDVRVARVADFDRRRFGLHRVPTERSAPYAQVKARLLQVGDTLLERSGGTHINPVGCPAYVEDLDGPTVCSNFVSRLRPREGVEGRYLSLVLGALYWTRQQEPHSTQTTGIQNLNTGSYFKTEVPDRTQGEQEDLAVEGDAQIASAMSQQAALTRSIELLTEYKQSLITAAVTGQLDVTTASTRIPE